MRTFQIAACIQSMKLRFTRHIDYWTFYHMYRLCLDLVQPPLEGVDSGTKNLRGVCEKIVAALGLSASKDEQASGVAFGAGHVHLRACDY